MRLIVVFVLLCLFCLGASALAEVSVVRTFPSNGSIDVDSKVNYIRVRFSEPVRPDGYSFVNSDQGAFLQFGGNPSFEDGNKLCIVPVKLAPGTTYAVSINSDKYQSFRSAADGTPVTPYLLKFTTLGSSSKNDLGMSSEKWQEDLIYLATELPKRHKNLFFKMTKNEWVSNVQQLRKQIPAMSDTEVMVGLTKLFALIGDQHTDISVIGNDRLKVMPLFLYWFKDGIFVVGASQEYKNLLGCQVVKIEDVDVDKACDVVSTLFCYDNDSGRKGKMPRFLAAPDFLKSLKLIPSTDTVSLTLKDHDGKNITARIRSVANGTDTKMSRIVNEAADPMPLAGKNPGRAYWAEYLEKEKLIYFKYNQCVDSSDYPFQKMQSDLEKMLAEHSDARLVVDIRSNSGGNSSILDPFIDSLKNNKDFNCKGRLFVITGRRTFSSAVLNATRLRTETNAIFVGETACGLPNHYGEVKMFTLPNSGLGVSYSTKYFEYSKEAISLVPDIITETTFAECLRGEDPALNAIINYHG